MEIGLVIFDALVRFHRGSETDPGAMAVVRQNLQNLTTAGITVVMIHHNSRRGTFRGGSEIIAMADSFLNLKKPFSNVRQFVLSIEKERTEIDLPWNQITIEPQRFEGITSLVGSTAMADENGFDDSYERILEFCDQLGRTKTEIRGEIKGDVVKVDAAISRLVQEGRMRVVKSGNSKLYMAVVDDSEV